MPYIRQQAASGDNWAGVYPRTPTLFRRGYASSYDLALSTCDNLLGSARALICVIVVKAKHPGGLTASRFIAVRRFHILRRFRLLFSRRQIPKPQSEACSAVNDPVEVYGREEDRCLCFYAATIVSLFETDAEVRFADLKTEDNKPIIEKVGLQHLSSRSKSMMKTNDVPILFHPHIKTRPPCVPVPCIQNIPRSIVTNPRQRIWSYTTMRHKTHKFTPVHFSDSIILNVHTIWTETPNFTTNKGTPIKWFQSQYFYSTPNRKRRPNTTTKIRLLSDVSTIRDH
ncbi:hypothetical protein LXL04_017089 [Taraxacum kok-saghyz]